MSISINNGDIFNYGPWGGNCQAFYVAGVLYMNRIGSSAQGIKTWKCKNVDDTKKLLTGQTVSVEWDNSGKYLSMTATDNNTLKVMHGSTPYYFKRSPPEPIISINNGDIFNYGPWGGNCQAFYVAGVLYMNRIGSSAQGIKTWKCKNVDETNKLLNGQTVSVEWDNSGNYLSMTATDNDTLKVMHGTTAYYFKREPEEPVISIKEGDEFFYEPWGGRCIASYVNGSLLMNRAGSSSAGIKTWSCKSADETMKLLSGSTVGIEWDNSGKYLDMTVTDTNTLKVMHGTTAYFFKRMMPLPAGSAFNYAPWGGKCVVSYGPTGKMYLGRTHVARTAKAYCMSMRNVYETSRLRAGFPVKVNWDNRNLYDVEMTMTDPNTLSVLHSNNQTYKFTKM